MDNEGSKAMAGQNIKIREFEHNQIAQKVTRECWVDDEAHARPRASALKLIFKK